MRLLLLRASILSCWMILFIVRSYGQGHCELVRELDGGSCISPDVLRFVLTEDYVVPTSQLLDYTIYDGERNVIVSAPDLTIARGRNYYAIPYDDMTGLAYGDFYTLEARINGGETRYLRFQVTTSSNQAQPGPGGTGTPDPGP